MDSQAKAGLGRPQDNVCPALVRSAFDLPASNARPYRMRSTNFSAEIGSVRDRAGLVSGIELTAADRSGVEHLGLPRVAERDVGEF